MGNIGVPSKDLAVVALYNHDGDTLVTTQYDERDSIPSTVGCTIEYLWQRNLVVYPPLAGLVQMLMFSISLQQR